MIDLGRGLIWPQDKTCANCEGAGCHDCQPRSNKPRPITSGFTSMSREFSRELVEYLELIDDIDEAHDRALDERDAA